MRKFVILCSIVVALGVPVGVTSPSTVGAVDDVQDVVTKVPARFLDTRPAGDTFDDIGKAAGVRPAGTETQIQITGRNNIPSNATAAVINIVAVNPNGTGFITAYPCGSTPPNASTLNHTNGVNIANGAIIAVGTGGRICLFNSRPTNLILDVNGYVSNGADLSTQVPARFLDTRPTGDTFDDIGKAAGVRPAGTETQIQITGRNNIPSNATAAVINITAANPSGTGFITAYPCGSTPPNASTLNHTNGRNIANGATIAIGTGGRVCLFNSRPTNLILDVIGYVTGNSEIATRVPGRFLDTRAFGDTIDELQEADGVRAAGTETQVQIIGRSNIPADATAAIINIVAVNPVGTGFVTAYPCGSNPPNASTLNHTNGVNIANGATIAIGTGGKICLFNSQPTNLIVDVSAHIDRATGFNPGSSLPPLTPDDVVREFVNAGAGRHCFPTSSNVQCIVGASNLTVAGTTTVTDIGAGVGSTCVSLEDGTITCYGTNDFGQLGNGTKTGAPNTAPVKVTGISSAVDVDLGFTEFSCATLENGTVQCWGRNDEGQLGNGTTVASMVPQTVPGVTNAVGVSAGGRSACALLTDHSVKCWGSGLLGNGTSSVRAQPVSVVGLDNAVSISVGGNHACAVTTDGEVLCWGQNGSGQLGNGTRTSSSLTVVVNGVSDAVGASAGGNHSCVRRASTNAACWGENAGGQSSGIPGEDRLTPVSPIAPETGQPFTGVTAIGTGDTFSVFLRSPNPKGFSSGPSPTVIGTL